MVKNRNFRQQSNFFSSQLKVVSKIILKNLLVWKFKIKKVLERNYLLVYNKIQMSETGQHPWENKNYIIFIKKDVRKRK